MLEHNVWEESAIYFQMGHNHPPTCWKSLGMSMQSCKSHFHIHQPGEEGNIDWLQVSQVFRASLWDGKEPRPTERERLTKRNLEKQVAGFWNIFFITWLLDRPSSYTLSLFVDAIGISSQLCLPLSAAGPPKTILNPGKSTRKLPLRTLADSDLDFQQSQGDVRFVRFCFASILILKDSMGSNSGPPFEKWI